MNHVKLLINGQDVDAQSGATFVRTSPITGEVVSTAAAAGVADVKAAIEAAQAAFPAWAAKSPLERRALLNAAAAKLRAKQAAGLGAP